MESSVCICGVSGGLSFSGGRTNEGGLAAVRSGRGTHPISADFAVCFLNGGPHITHLKVMEAGVSWQSQKLDPKDWCEACSKKGKRKCTGTFAVVSPVSHPAPAKQDS